MLVYGDRKAIASPRARLEMIAADLARAGAQAPGIERHALLVRAFIEAGEVAQGLADRSFEQKGFDDACPLGEAAMALVLSLARTVAASWRGGFATGRPDAGGGLVALQAQTLPPEVEITEPEGYAFYALYPESYLEAARRVELAGAQVVGLRSIGTGLAAMVATGLRAGAPITLRPCGDPGARELRLSRGLHERLTAASCFAVVDEGPGLSGSSFGAVGDSLAQAGAPRERIVFFPSHEGDPGARASQRHRRAWSASRRSVVPFERLCLDPSHGERWLGRWFEDLVGPPIAPLEELSAGAWRARGQPAAPWPPAWPQQERRKLLLRTASGSWLLKFAGLGRRGEALMQRARALHAAGFIAEPLALRHGFLLQRWVEEAATPDLDKPSEREAFLARAGDYLGFRAAAFPASRAQGAAPSQLAQMARQNLAEALGPRLMGGIERVLDQAPQASALSVVHTDNRLQRWEWLRTARGVLKADALDHDAGHDLVGCQDISWDIAGAVVEFDLGSQESERLAERVASRCGRRAAPPLLRWMEVCYRAYQIGYWSMAAEVQDQADQERNAAWRDHHIAKLIEKEARWRRFE